MSQLPCFSRVHPVIYVCGFHIPLADFIMFILGISFLFSACAQGEERL